MTDESSFQNMAAHIRPPCDRSEWKGFDVSGLLRRFDELVDGAQPAFAKVSEWSLRPGAQFPEESALNDYEEQLVLMKEAVELPSSVLGIRTRESLAPFVKLGKPVPDSEPPSELILEIGLQIWRKHYTLLKKALMLYVNPRRRHNVGFDPPAVGHKGSPESINDKFVRIYWPPAKAALRLFSVFASTVLVERLAADVQLLDMLAELAMSHPRVTTEIGSDDWPMLVSKDEFEEVFASLAKPMQLLAHILSSNEKPFLDHAEKQQAAGVPVPLFTLIAKFVPDLYRTLTSELARGSSQLPCLIAAQIELAGLVLPQAALQPDNLEKPVSCYLRVAPGTGEILPDRCDQCDTSLVQSFVTCSKCEPARYCSPACRETNSVLHKKWCWDDMDESEPIAAAT